MREVLLGLALASMLAGRAVAQEPPREEGAAQVEKRLATLERQVLVENASRLDLDYRSPDPTLTLAHAIFIPGGGWFYLGNHEGGNMDHIAKGMAMLAVTIGGAFFAARNREAAPFAITGLIVLRYFDLTRPVEEANRQRKQSQR